MNCKNCGAEISIQDRKCPYCKGIIDYVYPADNEKGYYNPFEDSPYYPERPMYNNYPVDPYEPIRMRAERDSQNAILCALLGMLLGFVIIRIVLSIISLHFAINAKKTYHSLNVYSYPRVWASIVLSIISLTLAFLIIVFFLIVIAAASLA